jgi:hypothetical protein
LVAPRPCYSSSSAAANAFVQPTLSTLLNEQLPSGQRATVLSLQELLWTLTVAPLAPTMLALADVAGIAVVFLVTRWPWLL